MGVCVVVPRAHGTSVPLCRSSSSPSGTQRVGQLKMNQSKTKKRKEKKGRKKFLVHLLSFSLFALSLHSLFRGLRAIPVHFVFGELKEE